MEATKCPLTDKWIKIEYYNRILLTHKKNQNKILPFDATWMDLEGIVLSERNQREKDKCHIISFICGI